MININRECRFTQLFWKDFLKDILHGKQVTKMIIFLGRSIWKRVSRFSQIKNVFTFRDLQ